VSLNSNPLGVKDYSEVVPEGFPSCDRVFEQSHGRVHIESQLQSLMLRSPITFVPIIDGDTHTAHAFLDDFGLEVSNIISHEEEKEIVQVWKDINSSISPIHYQLMVDF